MSQYIQCLSQAVSYALSGVTTAQPSQIAGYWANRRFWMDEFLHLLDVIEGFDERLSRMQRAEGAYNLDHGGPHNRDEFGHPRQKSRDTTSTSSRRFAASEARTALKALADRALDLRIASPSEYDSFCEQLRITNRSK